MLNICTNQVTEPLSALMSMAEWAPEQFNLAKAPKLQSTVKISPEPGLPSNFPRVAKWQVKQSDLAS